LFRGGVIDDHTPLNNLEKRETGKISNQNISSPTPPQTQTK
jgi:hypothetical protein